MEGEVPPEAVLSLWQEELAAALLPANSARQNKVLLILGLSDIVAYAVHFVAFLAFHIATFVLVVILPRSCHGHKFL